MEVTHVDPEELSDKGCIKTIQYGHVDTYNGLIFYYNTMRIDSVYQLRLVLVPIKCRQLLMAACHFIYLLYHSTVMIIGDNGIVFLASI